jgi:mono/diheme cytochrome c family protein
MPPWADELSEEERWAVALYTYTLAYSREQLELGEQVWQANCAECHGETGRGDGPKAAELPSPVGDLTQQPEVVALSDDDLYTIVTEGVGDMQSFAETLDEESRRAVAAYARTLALANSGVIGREVEPAATPEVQQAASAPGTVTGRVVNGTAASTVPADPDRDPDDPFRRRNRRTRRGDQPGWDVHLFRCAHRRGDQLLRRDHLPRPAVLQRPRTG